MNETIGAKGGHNDRLRTLKITKDKKNSKSPTYISQDILFQYQL